MTPKNVFFDKSCKTPRTLFKSSSCFVRHLTLDNLVPGYRSDQPVDAVTGRSLHNSPHRFFVHFTEGGGGFR